jgi:uncharacterized protein (UPF0305 family)
MQQLLIISGKRRLPFLYNLQRFSGIAEWIYKWPMQPPGTRYPGTIRI